MRRYLCAAVLLALVAAGCSRGEPETEPTSPATPAPVVNETPSPTPTPTPTPTLAPLTGLPLEDLDALERPVLAVKIDNARLARPPFGLELADLVIEEIVEGGTTRFIALYHSVDPGEIGPIRSGREVDADVLPPFTPLLVISGAAGPVKGDFSQAGLTYFEEGQVEGGFFRKGERPRPHNVMGQPETLWGAAPDHLAPPVEPWPFDAAAPEGGEEAIDVGLRFSSAASSVWTWDSGRGEWLRSQDGQPHMTVSEEQIGAATVIVAKVVVTAGSRVDSAGNPTADVRVIGEGDALILRDGRVYEVQWAKAGQQEQFQWLTADGEPFPLAPGRTWLELLPTSGSVTVSGPHTPAAQD